MPRPKRNELATKELHRNVQRLLRKRNIEVTGKDIELWAWAELGLRISDVSIWKVLSGSADPTACSVESLIAVAGFFHAEPSELGTFAEQRLAAIGKFFTPRGPSHQGIDASGWTNRIADSTPRPERHLRVVGL